MRGVRGTINERYNTDARKKTWPLITVFIKVIGQYFSERFEKVKNLGQNKMYQKESINK